MKILLTGAAGFIGMHVAQNLLKRGDIVIGIDNLSDYYKTSLKIARLEQLKNFPNFKFYKVDITDKVAIEEVFRNEKPERVINLAAQPGVRYSLKNPHVYVQTNLVGFCNLLEACRCNNVKHFVYASSSSVYGSNTSMPFSVSDNTDHPISLYAASKKANELMAHSYSHLYGLPTTGLRYFTVYGPWGRPDMSPWLFSSAILNGEPINVFNNGKMKRDFTFVEDIADGTVRVVDSIPKGDPAFCTDFPDAGSSYAPYKIYNIGNHAPIELMVFIEMLEKSFGRMAEKKFMPIQSGDVMATYADVDGLKNDLGFVPTTPLEVGIKKWVDWFKNYHKIDK